MRGGNTGPAETVLYNGRKRAVGIMNGASRDRARAAALRGQLAMVNRNKGGQCDKYSQVVGEQEVRYFGFNKIEIIQPCFLQTTTMQKLENLLNKLITFFSSKTSGPEAETVELLLNLVKGGYEVLSDEMLLKEFLHHHIHRGGFFDAMEDGMEDVAQDMHGDMDGGHDYDFEHQSLKKDETSAKVLSDKGKGQKTKKMNKGKGKEKSTVSGFLSKLGFDNAGYEKLNLFPDTKKSNFSSQEFLNMLGLKDIFGKSKPNKDRNKRQATRNPEDMEGRDPRNPGGHDMEEINPENLAYGLTYVLQQNKRESRCLIQILWIEDGNYEGEYCSKIGRELGQNIRNLMLKVLKKEVPTAFFSFTPSDLETMGRDLGESNLPRDTASSVMTKIMLPMTADDLNEVLQPILDYIKNLEDNASNENQRTIFQLINVIGRFFTQNMNDVASIIQDIQKAFILRYLSHVT